MPSPRSPSYHTCGEDGEYPAEDVGEALLLASGLDAGHDSSRFMGYSYTMQAMANAGVITVDGYHWGTPQLIYLDVECTGNLTMRIWSVPTKETVLFKNKKHIQFNSMHVCTLKAAGDRQGITGHHSAAAEMGDHGLRLPLKSEQCVKQLWRRRRQGYSKSAALIVFTQYHHCITILLEVSLFPQHRFLASQFY